MNDHVTDLAAKYLAYRPRTRQELCLHLIDRGVSHEDAESCADLMEEYHLIDDLQYAKMFIESGLESGRGMARIRRELQQKGVSRLIIEDAQAQMEELPDEYEIALGQAMEAIRDMDLRGMEYGEKQKLMGRIAGRLGRRGFPAETVYRAIRTAFAQRETQQQEEE